MSCDRRPEAGLEDILQNAAWRTEDWAGPTFEAFEADRGRRRAAERCLERVCEAVVRRSDRAEALMPGHPWRRIRDPGNRLRHAYDQPDAAILWEAAGRDVPALAAGAGRALRRPREG